MNIFFSSMGNVDFGIPMLLMRMTDEFKKRGHRCFYFGIKNGKGIDGNEELYRALNIQAVRIPINEEIDWEHAREYRNYTQSQLEDMIRCDFETKRLLDPNLSKDPYFKNVIRYLENLRTADEKYGIDMLVVWGMRSRERTIYYYAKRHNKKIFLLEHGCFRPYTLTLDPIGLNDENSLPRQEDFYKSIQFDSERYHKYLLSPERARPDLEFEEHYRKICQAHKIDNGYLATKKVSLALKAIKEKKFKTLAVKLNQKISRSIRNFHIETQFEKQELRTRNFLEKQKPFVFVPFQLEGDTQIICFSPYIRNMVQLVQLMAEAVDRYNSNCHQDLSIIFKPHPLYKQKNPTLNLKEIFKYCDRKNVYITLKVDTNTLIRQSEFVATVNSTVGIEALSYGKKVMTLGQAFYNIPGMVWHVDDPNNIPHVISDLINGRQDMDLVQRFLYHLRFNYLFEIYYLSPDKDSVKRLVDRMLEQN